MGKFVVIVLAALFLLSGCHKPIESEIGARLTTDEARKEVIFSVTEMKERLKLARATDILRFIFILAAFFSAVSWWRGSKGAVGIFLCSLGGLYLVHFDQKLAQMSWPYIVGVGFIVAAAIFFWYRDRIGKSAFRKILNGGILKKAEEKLVDKAKKNRNYLVRKEQ